MKTGNLQKSSRLLSALLNIGCTVIGILTVLLAIGIIVTACTPIVAPERFEQIRHVLAQISQNLNFTQCMIFFFSCLGMLICIFFALYNAKQIFSCIGKGISPFTKSTSSQIRKISMCIVIYAICGLISIFRISFGSLLICCLFAFILFCISLIFDYGCELQQEVDETL